jgi:hypothetical protein
LPETGDGIHVDVREIPPLSRSLLPRSLAVDIKLKV